MPTNQWRAFFVVKDTASAASGGEEAVEGLCDPEGGEDGEDE